MTRFRKWLAAVVVALALLIPLAQIASADPGDTGFSPGGYYGASSTRTTTAK